MSDSQDNDDPGEKPLVQFGGKGTHVVVDCDWGEHEMRTEGDADAYIFNNSVDGPVKLQGRSHHIDGLDISGTGESAIELLGTEADIFDLTVNPGYRYGLVGKDSEFKVVNSIIRGDKYDIKLMTGVLADFYDVQVDDILDLARGGHPRGVQEGILDEMISTTEEQIALEKRIGMARLLFTFLFAIRKLAP